MDYSKLLPADNYCVYDKAFLNNDKKDILVSLYQPIIGSLSVSLFLSLYNDLCGDITSRGYNHHHLMTLMQCSIDSIIEARRRLEAVGLMKSFLKEDSVNSYLYVLYSPIGANEFLNHPILNVVLYNNVGKNEYEMIVDKYRSRRLNVKDFKDVTCSFDDVFTSCNGCFFSNDDIVTDKTRRIAIKGNIDINLITSGIPRGMISDKCFTKDIIDLIINLAFIYRIDNLNMQNLIRNSINERGMIDDKTLKESCRNFYCFENGNKLPTLIYNVQPDYLKSSEDKKGDLGKVIESFENTSPYEFLKNFYNNSEPTSRDKKIIEGLMIEQKLNPGVVNVLIDYVLKTNNMKLNKELIETIAGHWKRLGFVTTKEAIDFCRKEHKKVKKNTKVDKKKDITLPDWFDKDISVNNSNDISELLKDFS